MSQDLGFVSGVGGDYESKVHLNSSATAENDNVILEIIEQTSNKGLYGDIILPESATTNIELVRAKVVSVGPYIKENIKKGDIVLYDRFAAFYNPPIKEGIVVVVAMENIICVLEPEMKPFGNTVLLKAEKPSDYQMIDEIFIPFTVKNNKTVNYKIMNIGTGRTDNVIDVFADIEVGQTVLINETGSIIMKISNEEYKIVSIENVLAVVG